MPGEAGRLRPEGPVELAAFAADFESACANRILDAALRCFTRHGVAKTTVDDVIREAGVSRATLYRNFAGRDGLNLAVLRREALAFVSAVEARLAGADTLEDVVVAVFVDAESAWRGHAVLTLMLETEPELLLPALVGPASPVLRVATDILLPHVVAHARDHPLAAADPARFAEWVVRTAMSYLMQPSPSVALGDEGSVRRFVADQFFAGRAPAGAHEQVDPPTAR